MPDRVTGASRLLVLLAATLGIALAAPLSALGRDEPPISGGAWGIARIGQ